jgi:xanthine dehydrogenase/oxidase
MFKKYRVTALAPGDVILSIIIPLTLPFEYLQAYKQARRREDDIALVGGAFRVRLQPAGASASSELSFWQVADVALAFSGMSFVSAQSPSAVASLMGADWSEGSVAAAMDALRKDLSLPENVPGGMAVLVRAVEEMPVFRPNPPN